MSGWTPDLLGEGYEQRTIELGPDPDGEGDVAAVVVRRVPREGEEVRGAVLYVHGFTDYFFQTALADFFAERGLAFLAVDLRKSGRARREGQTAHYTTDLARHDEELDAALDVVVEEHPDVPVLVLAHSTGGLVTPLWLDRRRRRLGTVAPVAGLVLNSPWFDLQGTDLQRGPVTQALRVLSKVRPLNQLTAGLSVYGPSLHTSGTGEWDYDLTMKPLEGCPVTWGWLNAVRRGHAQLHRGLDVGVPSLVLRSARSHFASSYSDASDRADVVLDVTHMSRWAGCLGGEVEVAIIDDARHDVFLSLPHARASAYERVGRWLDGRGFGRAVSPGGR